MRLVRPGIFLSLLPHFFYPICQDSPALAKRPSRATLGRSDLVVYRALGGLVVHSDVCPHQGASFAQGGRIDSGRLVCPYHGLCFDRGRFCGMGVSDRTHGPGRRVLDLHACVTDGRLVYATPSPGVGVTGVYQVPEVQDATFRAIHGDRDMDVSQQVVTENVLDMLHISHVHTFGDPAALPRRVRYTALGDYAGRSTFTYSPRHGTLATWLGRAGADVRVENEFHLPTTTVTRVFVGHHIKTVVTRAQPLGRNRTRLYWSIYRNFLVWPPLDLAMRAMMEKTLDEDVSILKGVRYTDCPILPLPQDRTIREYREACRRVLFVSGE
jgi:phenylpropionate dioxygenase-like ring-hydroxylating dioxygenase large terminal subunit